METLDKSRGKKPCPACGVRQMSQLNRIVHGDNAVTTYWRCPGCSHVQITRTPSQLNRDGRKLKASQSDRKHSY